MADIKVGDHIEYKLLSGFPMEVLEIAPCVPPEEHGGAPTHHQYRIIDPEGVEDWLCERSVRKVGE